MHVAFSVALADEPLHGVTGACFCRTGDTSFGTAITDMAHALFQQVRSLGVKGTDRQQREGRQPLSRF